MNSDNTSQMPPHENHHRQPTAFSVGEILRIVVIAVFIGGAAYLFCGTQFGKNLTQDHGAAFRTWLEQWGHWASLVFVLAGTGLISIGFPRLLLSFIAGALFDITTGFILAQTATILAAIPGYYSVRLLGRNVLVRRLGRRMRLFDSLLKDHGFMVFLLIRLCPVGHTLITSSLAGLSSVSFRNYFAASFIGFLPMTFVFVLLGSGFTDPYHLKLRVGIGAFVAFSFFFLWYFKRSALGRHITEIMRSKGE